MTPQVIFCHSLLHFGQSITVKQYSGGTACGCMTYRDSAHPEYSREWHRNNPAQTNCNGTGKIGMTLTTTSAKAHIMPLQLAINSSMIKKELLENIGEIQKEDYVLIGTANATTGTFIDLRTLNESYDYIIYDSVNYLVRHVYEYATDAVIGQMVLLKRKS